MKIKLTPSEILTGAMCGVMRQTENLKLGRHHLNGARKGEDWARHIEGALGEMAVAKALDVYWEGKGNPDRPDVGNIQVRTTRLQQGKLIVRHEDSADKDYYLVAGENGVYTIVG